MIRMFAIAALLATPALAEHCRDAHGRFIVCTKKVAVAPVVVKPARCRDVHGRFIKCKA